MTHDVRTMCHTCGAWYWVSDGHSCPSRTAAYIPPAAVSPSDLPDGDRPLIPGLTWVVPLESRPIALGPSTDRPEIRPALALDADRYWSHARHGLAVGRARRDLDTAARDYALDKAITNAAKDMS